MRRLAFVVLASILLLSSAPAVLGDGPEAGSMLVDMGNGETYWVDGASDPVADLVRFAEAEGMEVRMNGGAITGVGPMSDHAVGDQACGWRLFLWDGSGWHESLPSGYAGGTFAWGFYPDGIRPVETPDHRASWTQCRGDSGSTGVSDSYGTMDARTPVEWYNTYTTGYVDSGILVAGDLLYHTTYGADRQTGPDSHAWLYCEDRFTGNLVWGFDLSTGGDLYPDATGGGYNVTTPLIVGDFVVVNSAKEHTSVDGRTVMHMYCLDRLTGELLSHAEIVHDPPLDGDGNVAWDGRTFVNGGTTPVYDSGAVYLGTSDGRILAYGLSGDGRLTLLWEHVPPSDVSMGEYVGTRGSFYFHAPVIADVDGRRTLFIGNYEGCLISLDAATGAHLWSERLIDLGEANLPCPGTPGSVGSITVLPDGNLLAGCNDGGLSSITGYVVCVDASDGTVLWKKDVMMGGATVDGRYIYAYISSGEALTDIEGNTVEITPAVYKLDSDLNVVWRTGDYQTVKSALTLADGAIYMMDYSAGALYPTGGCLTAISADDGHECWRVLLEPYSTGSYSMVSPTVVDGRVYVGNDYGAVYCVSDVQGKSWGGGSEIVLEGGFDHWSWYVLALLVLASFALLYRFY